MMTLLYRYGNSSFVPVGSDGRVVPRCSNTAIMVYEVEKRALRIWVNLLTNRGSVAARLAAWWNERRYGASRMHGAKTVMHISMGFGASRYYGASGLISHILTLTIVILSKFYAQSIRVISVAFLDHNTAQPFCYESYRVAT